MSKFCKLIDDDLKWQMKRKKEIHVGNKYKGESSISLLIKETNEHRKLLWFTYWLSKDNNIFVLFWQSFPLLIFLCTEIGQLTLLWTVNQYSHFGKPFGDVYQECFKKSIPHLRSGHKRVSTLHPASPLKAAMKPGQHVWSSYFRTLRRKEQLMN